MGVLVIRGNESELVAAGIVGILIIYYFDIIFHRKMMDR